MITEFNRRMQYYLIISGYIKEEFEINNIKYNLKAIICTPKYNHFTAIIYNYKENYYNQKKDNNYYYDGMSKNHDISLLKNTALKLKTENPYIALYQKSND